MLRIEGGEDQKGAPPIAHFSEREAVKKRLELKDEERKARSLKDIYGSACAEELRHIITAIFRELSVDRSSMQSSGS
jgi:hypothetical protein